MSITIETTRAIEREVANARSAGYNEGYKEGYRVALLIHEPKPPKPRAIEVGDRVLTLSNDGDYDATVGTKGTVTRVSSSPTGLVWVTEDTGYEASQYAHRYELIPEVVHVLDAAGLDALAIGSEVVEVAISGYRIHTWRKTDRGWFSITAWSEYKNGGQPPMSGAYATNQMLAGMGPHQVTKDA